MIPEFPEFKNLELADKGEIEEITRKFPPYSDFNFMSMWTWNLNNEIQVSRRGAHLIVRFSDYLTGRPFLSFMGDDDIDQTAALLLSLSEQLGYAKELKLLPECVASALDVSKFQIREDRDNYDYVLTVDRLKPHDGSERKLSTRRKLINKIRSLENFYVRPITIGNEELACEILKVSINWEKQKGITDSEATRLHDALRRAVLYSHDERTFCLGAFLDDKLVGYSINEVVGGGYAVGNFQQADLAVSAGIYALLMEEAAIYLSELGCSYINLEQDLGIPGLRKWKSSYGPSDYLKKYTVSVI